MTRCWIPMAAAGQLQPRFEWASVPTGAAGLAVLVGAAAVAVLIWSVYRRESSGGRRRWLLFGFRLFVMGLTGLLLLGPSVAYDRERVEPGRTLVLLDSSASMAFRDRHMDEERASGWAAALGLDNADEVRALSRHELVRGALDGGVLDGLSARSDVEVVAFAGDAQTFLEIPRGERPEELPDWAATGETTDLASAVRKALDTRGRLAAVLCLTDGRDTAGGDLEAAARAAQERGVPLHFVGVGSPVAPRNVTVVRLVSNDSGVLGQPLAMRALVRARGYAGRRVEVVLTASAPDESTTEVLRKSVELAEGRTREVDLTHVPQLAGAVRYRARIEPLPGELQDDDNAAPRRVRVTERKRRLLLIADAPSRQYRFLEPLVRRHPDFEADSLLGGEQPPADRAGLMQYDVVLLCDPPPALLTEEWLGTLAGLVDGEGLGLVFVAGPVHTPEVAVEPAARRLREMLPVAFDRAAAQGLIGGAGVYSEQRALRPQTLHHTIMRLGPDGQPEAFWNRAPGPYWAFPVTGGRRGATVLLRCSSAAAGAGAEPSMPLFAVQQYGLGRVLYCGSPETWRWRRESVEAFEAFWLSALRYCASGRYAGAERRAAIRLETAGFRPGEAIAVRASLLDERLRPVTRESVSLSLYRDGEPVRLVPLRRSDEPGDYTGTLYVAEFGSFSLEYEAPDGFRAAETFEVVRPEAEFADVRADLEGMRRAAELSGGRYFGPESLAELPGAVPDLSRTVIEPGPLEPLWDRWWLLAGLVGTLAAEWALRKRWGMM